MAKAIFILPDGKRVTLDVESGASLMKAATTHGIAEIVGDCGGAMSCATCHVFVSTEFLGRLPPVSDNEDQMLDCTAAPRQPNSRLSCQIAMTDDLDGIIVTTADPQV